MKKTLNELIRESVRKALFEMDIVPTDKNGEVNLVKNQSVNAWRMIYRLMGNVKQSMNYTYQGKQGKISSNDIDNIIDYIYNSLQNITRNTIGRK